MLGRLLLKVTDDVSSQDLHDRGLLYYRLLKSGADPKTVLTHVISNSNASIPGDQVLFSEEDDKELRAELMKEFDSLSTIYGKNSLNFIKPEYQVVYKKMPAEHPLDPAADTSAGASVAQVPVAPQGMPQPATVPVPAAAPPVQNMVEDLLGFDSPALVPTPAAPQTTAISLVLDAKMAGDEYQAKWGSICTDADAIVEMVALSALPASTSPIEANLATIGVKTMASGQTAPGEFKLYLYARDHDGSIILIQANISNSGGEPLMILTIKIEGSVVASAKASQLLPIIQGVMR